LDSWEGALFPGKERFADDSLLFIWTLVSVYVEIDLRSLLQIPEIAESAGIDADFGQFAVSGEGTNAAIPSTPAVLSVAVGTNDRRNYQSSSVTARPMGYSGGNFGWFRRSHPLQSGF
jgi:hypothetical protein